MKEFYTNFLQDGSHFLISGYRDGKKFYDRVSYQPYLFVNAKPGSMSPYKTLWDEKVDRIDFDNIWDAKLFLKDKKDISGYRVHGSEKFLYNCIYDRYPENIEYDYDLIRKGFLDLETLTPQEGGFPDPLKAEQEITTLSVEYNGIYHSFGMIDFDIHDPLLEGLKVKYYRCQDEKDLLLRFLDFWTETDLDICSGWNVLNFDFTYLYNRLKNVLGASRANRLSPYGKVSVNEFTKYGKTQTEIAPSGISILDYLDLYRKFSYTPQESYKLDHISKEELGVGKLDYSEYDNLNDFYRKNPQKYICYNIIDTDRVVKLEEKLKLIEMVCSFAYEAKINFQDTFTTVLPWDCIITNFLMAEYTVVPQRMYDPSPRDIMGGYVKEVRPGKYPWVISIDADSLYPHIQMYLNISPETLVDKIPGITPEDVLRGNCKDYLEDSKRKGLTFSGIGVRYHKKFKGVMPRIIETKYNARKAAKQEMLRYEDELEKAPKEKRYEIKKLISKFKNKQQNAKIVLNSGFGALANAGFRYTRSDMAESITSTGQVIIQFCGNEINTYLDKVTGVKKDRVIASDTDSVYFSLEDLVNQYKKPDWDDRRIVEFCEEVYENAIIPLILKKFRILAETLNAYDPEKIRFKLETICPASIFNGKKKNALYVAYKEGIHYDEPKVKVTGLEAVRSSTPQLCKDYIKKAFKIIMTKDEDSLQNYIRESKIDFFSNDFEKVAFPRGVQGIKEYSTGNKTRFQSDWYKLRTPIHVRASIVYNNLLELNGLDKYYPYIADGDKIKFVYLKEPNPIGSNVIASPIDRLPKELDLEKYIDYDMQWEKTFLQPVQNVLDGFGWNTEKKASLNDWFG